MNNHVFLSEMVNDILIMMRSPKANLSPVT